MNNMTLLIDPDTRDLVFDENGLLKTICDSDTVVQNIRHSLLTWKSEFFSDETHGTEYEKIMGLRENDLEQSEIEEIIREAVYQESEVSSIEEINIAYEKRSLIVDVVAVIEDGERIRLEVTV